MEKSVPEGKMQLLSADCELSGIRLWCNAALCRGTRSVTESRVTACDVTLHSWPSLPAQASSYVDVVVL